MRLSKPLYHTSRRWPLRAPGICHCNRHRCLYWIRTGSSRGRGGLGSANKRHEYPKENHERDHEKTVFLCHELSSFLIGFCCVPVLMLRRGELPFSDGTLRVPVEPVNETTLTPSESERRLRTCLRLCHDPEHLRPQHCPFHPTGSREDTFRHP